MSTMCLYAITSKEALNLMNGNRGKLSAQTGHAYLHSVWNSDEAYPENVSAYREGLARKVTLVVETNEDLIRYRDLIEDLRICATTTVVDAGLTVFKAPTMTCIGVGPVDRDLLPEWFKRIPVLI